MDYKMKIEFQPPKKDTLPENYLVTDPAYMNNSVELKSVKAQDALGTFITVTKFVYPPQDGKDGTFYLVTQGHEQPPMLLTTVNPFG
jgi:hypothetical protein